MLNRWLYMLKKATGPIRQRGAQEALKELEGEGFLKLEDDDGGLGGVEWHVINSEDEG